MDDREFHSVIAHLRVAGTDNQSFEVKSCRKELTRDIGRTISGSTRMTTSSLLKGSMLPASKMRLQTIAARR